MNSPADAAESHQTEKVCEAQAWSLQGESCRSTRQHDQDKVQETLKLSYRNRNHVNTTSICHVVTYFTGKQVITEKEAQ